MGYKTNRELIKEILERLEKLERDKVNRSEHNLLKDRVSTNETKLFLDAKGHENEG